MRHFALATAALTIVLASPAVAKPTPEEIAAAALEAAPVWDGHNDVPYALRERFGNVINDFDFVDTLDTETPETKAMHTDLTRLHKGHLGAQFWSVYVSASLPEPEAVQQTIEQIDVTKRLVARYPDAMQLALTADDVARALKAHKIASLMGMEGGQSIGSSLAVLRQMYALGARYMTLTHSKTLSWADSATDTPKHGGLTDFGRDVVREMNRLGMLVDLSHVSEATMHDALDAAQAPVIFSHSGARAINGHARNVPDSVLARLPENGGVVMVVALPGFLSEEQRAWFAARSGEEARLKTLWQGQPDEVAAQLAKWDATNPTPLATTSQMADHIDHVRDIAGIDHIGIGGDYDGMPGGPVGMEDVSGYPVLFAELARRGYSQEDLEKIASRNVMRVLRAAEAYAASQADALPIESSAAAEAEE
ncbi:dipeptidase [Erythrobacter mangrovi]|uniref:Membrane dipeptidase n=1 Tax=Erythrobacter mangrovi TaxID=2739433 RepID=A0A7D3XTZ8_9SPHN|nr:dipeptidase [Erythrobacter mangrovi]QKG70496.1 membrane dipeptidase [Erythrobacter mangrovi]